MGSSVAYPVDSLRSASFTQKYGTAPSIMDYARFNYIAQPEDKGVALMPNIGPYDKHAINWGYRPILDQSAEEEKATLNQWILDKADDPMYRFGRQQRPVIDPSSQTEDLGDDAVKASNYGIANLKRIVPKLIDWTYEEGKNYDDLSTLYDQVFGQFNRYMGHVRSNIGGVYQYNKTYDQEGAVFTHVSKNRQSNSMAFLHQQLFTTPYWMLDKNILSKAGFTEGSQSDGTGKKDENWIKTFIEEQNPEKNVMNSLPKVATDELKRLLKKLVKNEDYEAAAKVRDELSKRGEKDE